jgi:hypothetical protein
MFTRVGSADAAAGGNLSQHNKMATMHAAYVTKFKQAAAKSKDLAWLPEAFNKFRRDVSQGSDFNEVFKDARATRSERHRAAKALLGQIEHGIHVTGDLTFQKAGVTTTLGYNFIDLRGPAALLYPVNTPFRDSTPRMGKVNGGVGTMAQWKATTIVGSQYAGVPEAQRAQVSAPNEQDYAAKYKAIGVERNVSVEAEWAGEGFTGNLADEHLRGLQSLWLQEEGIMLLGNDGSQGVNGIGYNGFQLGTAPAPVATEITTSGTLPATTKITGYVVLLTGMGLPNNAQYGYQPTPSVTSGLTPTFTVNAPGTGASITYTGGTSGVSVASNSITTAAANHSVQLQVRPASVVGAGGYPNGTFGFAWFVSSNASPTTANAFLTAITRAGKYVVAAAPPSSGQTAAAAGLNVDNSAQATDFTGLLTYAATSGRWVDLEGAQLTSAPGGVCVEVEAVLEYMFNTYQAGVDAIWGSPDAITSLNATILQNGSQSPSGYQVYLTKDDQNNIIGGLIVSGYQSRYAVASPTGANVIPLKMHPMIPLGTLFFDITTNPYPESRIPFTRAIDLMRDYYGYEWPAINRAWSFGTYADEAQAHYTPWLTAVITGIGQTN